jgi:hypothetical protein
LYHDLLWLGLRFHAGLGNGNRVRWVSFFYLCVLYGWLLLSVRGSGLRIVSCVAPGLPGDIVPGDHFSCMPGADPATCICYAHMVKHADDGAAHERSVFSEQWAAITYHQVHDHNELPLICAPRARAPRWRPHVQDARNVVYSPGKGIALYIDLLNHFGDGIVSVSLGGGALMWFACASTTREMGSSVLMQVAGWMSGTFSNRGFDLIMSFESLSVFFRNICGILVLS